MNTTVRLSSLVIKCSCTHRSLSCTATLPRLRSEWRRDRPPAYTKLSDVDVVEERKTFGGRKKWKAISLSQGVFSLKSHEKEYPLKIVDVVYSDAGKHIGDNKILVKGSYIVLDAKPIKSEIQLETLVQVSDAEEQLPNHIVHHVDELLRKEQVYAKVTSKPGQVGKCEGVIVEGRDLKYLVDRLLSEENSSDSSNEAVKEK